MTDPNEMTPAEREAYSEPEDEIDDAELARIAAEIKRIEEAERTRGWR